MKLIKYSYQDCWNYALALQEKVKIEEIKSDIITLCRATPEKFWSDFANKSLSASDYSQICRNLDKYLKENYPVPYLTNQVYFYGLSFYIKEGVFIPQPDTEILVEKVLELANKYWGKEIKLKVLEIGTGCGNIVIPLAKSKPNWSFTTVEINSQALAVAKKNSIIHQTKNIKFVHSNLFNNLSQSKKFDIIVSNPPYISSEEYQGLPSVVKAQPIEALIAENDGYFFYQKIFQQAREFLAKRFLLVVEVGYQQAKKVVKLIMKYFPQSHSQVFFDYNGQTRVIVIFS